MRWLALVLLLLVVALQYTMWLGKGGWLQVRELSREIDKQQQVNAKLKARNDALDADVRDLKGGVEAIEERARGELGMVRGDEVFFQLQPKSEAEPAPRNPADAHSKTGVAGAAHSGIDSRAKQGAAKSTGSGAESHSKSGAAKTPNPGAATQPKPATNSKAHTASTQKPFADASSKSTRQAPQTPVAH